MSEGSRARPARPAGPEGHAGPYDALKARAVHLLTLAFGTAILLGILVVATTVSGIMLHSRGLALLNLVWAGLAVAMLAYLSYERSKLMLRP